MISRKRPSRISFQLNTYLNMMTYLKNICFLGNLLSKYFLEGGLFPLHASFYYTSCVIVVPRYTVLHLASDVFVQTEAERRRREAGVKQSMSDETRSWVMYVCMYVCVVLDNILRTKAPSATKEVPNDRSQSRTLLRHHYNFPGAQVCTHRANLANFGS